MGNEGLLPQGESGLSVTLNIHLHLTAEVKNAWSYTITPPFIFTTWCLIKHRDNFTFIIAEEKHCGNRSTM
jgi:urea transporter